MMRIEALLFCFNNNEGLVSILMYGILNAMAINNVVPIMMTTAVVKVIGMFIAAAIAIRGGIIRLLLAGINRA